MRGLSGMTLTPEQEAEIVALRAETRPTLRATVPALEEILYRPIPVLDHGFIRVIDYMGDDFRSAAVDSPSHGQCERVFGALFDSRSRVLPAGSRSARHAIGE
jgi:hypothetical protein